jgi:hypothetical protein
MSTMPEATKPGPDSQPLVGASEAAEIMNVELSTFSHLRRREEQTEGSKFPKPLAVLRCGPVWKTADIKRFATRYVAPRPGPKPAAAPATPAKATKATKATKAAPKNAVKVLSTVKASDKANGTVVKLNGKPSVKKVAPRKVVAKKVPATV